MHYSNVLQDFDIAWKAMGKWRSKIHPKLPTLSKINTPLKWCESFKHYLHSIFGVRKIPLTYVIYKSEFVTPGSQNDPSETYDPLQTDNACGNSGSVLGDLIARTSHFLYLFKSNSATVFDVIEGDTRGSVYSTTIKPFARKIGRIW